MRKIIIITTSAPSTSPHQLSARHPMAPAPTPGAGLPSSWEFAILLFFGHCVVSRERPNSASRNPSNTPSSRARRCSRESRRCSMASKRLSSRSIRRSSRRSRPLMLAMFERGQRHADAHDSDQFWAHRINAFLRSFTPRAARPGDRSSALSRLRCPRGCFSGCCHFAILALHLWRCVSCHPDFTCPQVKDSTALDVGRRLNSKAMPSMSVIVRISPSTE